MTNKFLQALESEASLTLTENGAVAHSTTGSALVDLFAIFGAIRDRAEFDVKAMFRKAFTEDALLATKMAFYGRDIRNGLGERKTAKVIWSTLAQLAPEIMVKNIQYIPMFGRWDDLFILEGSLIEESMWALIMDQWSFDKENLSKNEGISLMAKWLPSADTSSDNSRRLARKLARRLGVPVKEYQATLRQLRRYLDIPEIKMSANQWDKIVYSAVPSRAMMLYRKAFGRQDQERFGQYIESLTKGEEKVNASTLYPYDLMEKMGLTTSSYTGYMRSSNLSLTSPDPLLEAQWKAQPNHVQGENNFLIMADTSGSMENNSNSRPLYTAVGLAVYFAERNKGAFKDVFMTFSSKPSFVRLKGDTLAEKVACIPSIVQDTNLDAAFDLILETAIHNKIPAEEMPKALVVISDMEINDGTGLGRGGSQDTFHKRHSAKFAQAGYEMPNVVYWNVHSRQNVYHSTCHVPGVQLASGHATSTFKSIITNMGMTGYEGMVQTLSNPIYDCITL